MHGASDSLSIHFVRAWVVQPWVRYLDRLGVPTEDHLLAAHVAPDLLEDEMAPVPLRLATRFVERVARAEGIDHLGLRVAAGVTPNDLGHLKTLMALSRNLGEYIRAACRYVPSVSTAARYALEVRGDTARFHYWSVDLGCPDPGDLFTLGATINTVRAVADEAWRPEEIVVARGGVGGLAEISEAFEHVRPDSTARTSSFTFPSAYLALPFPGSREADSTSPEANLESLAEVDFLRASRRLLSSLVIDGCANVHTAAEAAGMCTRTFQRRLASSGVCFSELLKQARIGVAERWLVDGDRSVADIADALGYTDPSNFTRAFRRHTGMPPRAFRQARLGPRSARSR